MTINSETLMQFVTCAPMIIVVAAFLVSVITQVIKEMPILKNIQTNAVALTVSMILCPVAVIIACQYFSMVIRWYYIFSAFVSAFIVYLVATGGWERVTEMWNRTKVLPKHMLK